jgi:acetyl-CoA/propionyl-CoA carboxylase biotin carboxyl carrier protein
VGAGGAAGGKAARRTATKAKAGASGDAVVAPMQGTIVKVAVSDGDTVAAGDLVVVLEAMKMEQPLTAHKAGVVHSITAEVGTTVPTGTELLQIKD